jgi:hypothetical protein
MVFEISPHGESAHYLGLEVSPHREEWRTILALRSPLTGRNGVLSWP